MDSADFLLAESFQEEEGVRPDRTQTEGSQGFLHRTISPPTTEKWRDPEFESFDVRLAESRFEAERLIALLDEADLVQDLAVD